MAATLRRWAADESLWVTVGAFVAGVLTSIPGLAPIAPVVRAAIDSSAGAIVAVFVGGKAHRTAAAIKAGTVPASTASKTDPIPAEVAAILRQAGAAVDKLAGSSTPPAGS